MATETPKQTRNRNHNTALAFHSKRMKLGLKDLERITREPYDNLKNWRQGRRRTPRIVFRMLAAWRLLHWGQF